MSREMFIFYNKNTGDIESSGRNFDRVWDEANRDGSTCLEYIERQLDLNPDHRVLFCPNGTLPDPEEVKVNHEFKVLAPVGVARRKSRLAKKIRKELKELYLNVLKEKDYLKVIGDDIDDVNQYIVELKTARTGIRNAVKLLTTSQEVKAFDWRSYLPEVNY